jgi:GT2 family glycosyltransferase
VVSIVIVTHDARTHLERCLPSIAVHAGVETETIVVDNASADGTAAWVREAHPAVRLVELERNVGVAARAQGLDRARGELIMFLDSDAALTPGALPRMVVAMEQNPDWGLLGPKLVHDDGSLQLSCRRFPPFLLPFMGRPPFSRFLNGPEALAHHWMAEQPHDRTRPVVWVMGACQLFRAGLAHRAGPFPDYFIGQDDTDWCLRIRDLGAEVVYFPEATVVHSYQHLARGRTISRIGWEHARSWARFEWRYARRRRELEALGEELDRRALDQR